MIQSVRRSQNRGCYLIFVGFWVRFSLSSTDFWANWPVPVFVNTTSERGTISPRLTRPATIRTTGTTAERSKVYRPARRRRRGREGVRSLFHSATGGGGGEPECPRPFEKFMDRLRDFQPLLCAIIETVNQSPR